MRRVNDYCSLSVRLSEVMAKRTEIHSDPPLAEILTSQPRLGSVTPSSS